MWLTACPQTVRQSSSVFRGVYIFRYMRAVDTPYPLGEVYRRGDTRSNHTLRWTYGKPHVSPYIDAEYLIITATVVRSPVALFVAVLSAIFG